MDNDDFSSLEKTLSQHPPVPLPESLHQELNGISRGTGAANNSTMPRAGHRFRIWAAWAAAAACVVAGLTAWQLTASQRATDAKQLDPAPKGGGESRIGSGGPTLAAATESTTLPTSRPNAGEQNSTAEADVADLAPAQLDMPEPQKDLTLKEAIYRTVNHALVIKVEAYNPAIKESQILAAVAALDPAFFGTSRRGEADELAMISSQAPLSNRKSWQSQVGIRQLHPSDGHVTAAGDAALPQFPPAKNDANIDLTLMQPLSRGVGRSVPESSLYLAQRDYRVSLSEFKQRVISSVTDVEGAYQNLVLARTNMEVLKRLVSATEQTYRDVWERRGIDATKASLTQALQAVLIRRADLLDAQKAYRAASDHLKSLMNDPDFDVTSNVLINPVDTPSPDTVAGTAEENIDIALRQRPEMQQALLQVERADIVVKVAHNGLLPKLDFTIGLQSLVLADAGGKSNDVTTDAVEDFGLNAVLILRIPTGNREAESILRRRLNERKQALENLEQIAAKIVLDVRTQSREVKSTYESVALRNFARQAAANECEGILEIDAIQKRNPEFLQLKLDSQARLASAEQQLIQSLVNYNLAIMRLEQAKGTLLEFNGISLDRPPTQLGDGLRNTPVPGDAVEKNQMPSTTAPAVK